MDQAPQEKPGMNEGFCRFATSFLKIATYACMHVPAAFRTLLKNTAIIAMETKRLYQWAIAAAFMICLPMCISSCIPDDTPDSGSAIVCINTASLCEKLGIADLVAGMLAGRKGFLQNNRFRTCVRPAGTARGQAGGGVQQPANRYHPSERHPPGNLYPCGMADDHHWA